MPTSSSSRDATSKLFTRVPAAELRTWGPLVRIDAIRAGDVLLSRGQGRESALIAMLTGGRYSHAAILLPYLSDGLKGPHLDVVEAHNEGVAAVPPRSLTIAFSGGRRYDVFRFTREPPPKAAVLLRHPDIKSVDESTFRQAVRMFSDAELMRRYSSIDRLVEPLFLPGPVKRMLGRALLRDPQPKRLILPGCFCSELVAKFYELLGLRLFARPMAPEKVSPNRLGSWWRSRLLVVPDAIFTEADIPDDAYAEVIDELQVDLRTRYVWSLVDVREKTAIMAGQKKAAEDLTTDVGMVEDGIAGMSDAMSAVLHASLVALRAKHANASPKVRRMFEALLDRSTFLKLLREHLRSEKLPSEARLDLRLFHDQQVTALGHCILRARAIAESSAEEGREKRISALADRQAQRAKARAAPARPIPPASDDTVVLVKRVLKEVAAKAEAAPRAPG